MLRLWVGFFRIPNSFGNGCEVPRSIVSLVWTCRITNICNKKESNLQLLALKLLFTLPHQRNTAVTVLSILWSQDGFQENFWRWITKSKYYLQATRKILLQPPALGALRWYQTLDIIKMISDKVTENVEKFKRSALLCNTSKPTWYVCENFQLLQFL